MSVILPSSWPEPRLRRTTQDDRVLDAAVEVIAQRGVERTRYRDVAERAGVSIGTLQHAFGTLRDLQLAAFRHAVDRDLRYLEGLTAGDTPPWTRLVAIVDGLLLDDERLTTSRRLWIEFWRFAVNDPEMHGTAARVYDAWHAAFDVILEEGIAAGDFRPRASVEAEVTLLFAALDGIAIPLVLGLETGLSEARAALVDQLAWRLGVSTA